MKITKYEFLDQYQILTKLAQSTKKYVLKIEKLESYNERYVRGKFEEIYGTTNISLFTNINRDGIFLYEDQTVFDLFQTLLSIKGLKLIVISPTGKCVGESHVRKDASKFD